VDVALGPHDIVRPHLAGWRRERLPRPGAARPIGVAPDWICQDLEALALRDGAWLESGVYDDQSVARIAPFEAIEIEVGRLFLPRDADDLPGEDE
jgi:hypothetical protein